MTTQDEFFATKNTWFKFDKIGARVMGIVTEIFDAPSTNPIYPDQRVFVLQQEDGSMINATIKKTSKFLMEKTADVVVGDTIGFSYDKDIPAKVKGFNPAKSINCVIKKGDGTVPTPTKSLSEEVSEEVGDDF